MVCTTDLDENNNQFSSSALQRPHATAYAECSKCVPPGYRLDKLTMSTQGDRE